MESDYQNVSARGGYIGSPVVAPFDKSGRPLLFFQAALYPDHGSVLAVDPMAGVVAEQYDGLGDDVDNLAVVRSAAAGGGGLLQMAVPTVCQKLQCADGAGSNLTMDAPDGGGMPAFFDTDHDGVAEILYDHSLVDFAKCEARLTLRRESEECVATVPALFDATGQFEFWAAGPLEVTSLDGAASYPWDWSGVDTTPADTWTYTASVWDRAGEIRLVRSDSSQLSVADSGGRVLWSRYREPTTGLPPGACDNFPAVGDLDGDAVPDIVTCEGRLGEKLIAYSLSGALMWRAPAQYEWGPNGGMALADLDADARYEVVSWSDAGLRILDGATGQILAETQDVVAYGAWSQPVIADVDGDGSAEIVVAGDWASEADEPREAKNDHLFVLGPKTGRWARTRPVWNQTPYDVVSVADDGSAVRFPWANWQTYNSYRAQPAHDGDLPDLQVKVTGACADTCSPGGTVWVAAQVGNAGSHEAAAGARVSLHTWSEAEGVTTVGEATVADPIPSGQDAAGVVFAVPWEQWRAARYLQVDGADPQECDRVNDRVDVWEDPCSEAGE